MSTACGSASRATAGKGTIRRRCATRPRSSGSVRIRKPAVSTRTVACPTNVTRVTAVRLGDLGDLGEVAGVDQIPVERLGEGVGLGGAPVGVEPIGGAGDLHGRLVQPAIEAVQDLVGELTLAPGAALAAAEQDPDVDVVGRLPL